MATTVIDGGQTIIVRVSARGIAGTQIVAGRLIVTYDDGTSEDAGPVGGGVIPPEPGVYMMDFRVPANARYLGAQL